MHYDAIIEENQPYLKLIAATVLQAINDCKLNGEFCHKKGNGYYQHDIQDAIEFIFSDRLDVYCSILDIDPDALREGLIKETRERCHDVRITAHQRDMENRKRYNFKVNYDLYGPATGNELYKSRANTAHTRKPAQVSA